MCVYKYKNGINSVVLLKQLTHTEIELCDNFNKIYFTTYLENIIYIFVYKIQKQCSFNKNIY